MRKLSRVTNLTDKLINQILCDVLLQLTAAHCTCVPLCDAVHHKYQFQGFFFFFRDSEEFRFLISIELFIYFFLKKEKHLRNSWHSNSSGTTVQHAIRALRK